MKVFLWTVVHHKKTDLEANAVNGRTLLPSSVTLLRRFFLFHACELVRCPSSNRETTQPETCGGEVAEKNKKLLIWGFAFSRKALLRSH